MPENLVPESVPVARNSPYTLMISIVWRALGGAHESTHLGLELGELEPPAVKLEYIYRRGRVCLFVRGRRGFDVRRVLSLPCPSARVGETGSRAEETLQFLHLQTKLASPLLPLISFCSKRLTETKLACVSRHDVHCTLNV